MNLVFLFFTMYLKISLFFDIEVNMVSWYSVPLSGFFCYEFLCFPRVFLLKVLNMF